MQFRSTDTYVAPPDLALAVNAAVTLERPLLVKGEPGTGKTELAKVVATEAGLDLFEVEYADRDGNIGYQAPGRLPLRGAGDGTMPQPGWDSAYDWTGFIPFDDLPVDVRGVGDGVQLIDEFGCRRIVSVTLEQERAGSTCCCELRDQREHVVGHRGGVGVVVEPAVGCAARHMAICDPLQRESGEV